MNLLSYTTYDDIRAALGVSSDELEDATLGLSFYANNLQMELEDVDFDLSAAYELVNDIPVATRTSVQTRFYQTAGLFATYAVAKQLSASLPMFGPKAISDGKATVERFANPYTDTIKSVKAQYDRTRAKLESAYAAINSATMVSISRVFFAVSTPASDPVTNT